MKKSGFPAAKYLDFDPTNTISYRFFWRRRTWMSELKAGRENSQLKPRNPSMTDMMLRIEVLSINNREANKPWDTKILWIHLARQGKLTGDHYDWKKDANLSYGLHTLILNFLGIKKREEILFQKARSMWLSLSAPLACERPKTVILYKNCC